MRDPERELVARLLARPDDLELRRVYADLLVERDLPRGEFIQLQLLASPTKAQRTRMRELERRHTKSWLAPLAALIVNHTYEGGFLSQVELRRGDAAAWDALLSPSLAHEIATIRSLTLDLRTRHEPVAPLLQGRLTLLERLSITPELAELVRCPVRHLEITIPYETAQLPPIRIGFDPAPLELRFTILDQDLLEPYGATLMGRVLREGQPTGTARVVVRSGIELALTRGEHGALSQLDVRCTGHERHRLVPTLMTILADCPDRAFTSVQVGALLTPPERRQITRALARSPGAALTSD